MPQHESKITISTSYTYRSSSSGRSNAPSSLHRDNAHSIHARALQDRGLPSSNLNNYGSTVSSRSSSRSSSSPHEQLLLEAPRSHTGSSAHGQLLLEAPPSRYGSSIAGSRASSRGSQSTIRPGSSISNVPEHRSSLAGSTYRGNSASYVSSPLSRSSTVRGPSTYSSYGVERLERRSSIDYSRAGSSASTRRGSIDRQSMASSRYDRAGHDRTSSARSHAPSSHHSSTSPSTHAPSSAASRTESRHESDCSRYSRRCSHTCSRSRRCHHHCCNSRRDSYEVIAFFGPFSR